MHSRRRLEVFRRTNSASTICLAMSWLGLKIAGTPTIAARLLMARRGSLETVVGALCVAVPGTLISASSARLTAAGSARPIGSPPSGSAWPEHSTNLSQNCLSSPYAREPQEPVILIAHQMLASSREGNHTMRIIGGGMRRLLLTMSLTACLFGRAPSRAQEPMRRAA